MKISDFEDIVLECRDCGHRFTWFAGEQRYYADRQYSAPRRCRECRRLAKEQQHQPDSTTSAPQPEESR